MTILEANSILISYLVINKRDSIQFNDIESLIPLEENKQEGVAAIIGSLNDMVSKDVMSAIQPDPKDFHSIVYVLKKPLPLYSQKIEIGGLVALEISKIVNLFTQNENDNKTVFSDPLAIKEEDLITLLNIINNLSGENES